MPSWLFYRSEPVFPGEGGEGGGGAFSFPSVLIKEEVQGLRSTLVNVSHMCITGVIHMWYFLCITIVIHTSRLHMYYMVHVWNYMCNAGVYLTHNTDRCNTCVTDTYVIHMQYNVIHIKSPHMNYRCGTAGHVDQHCSLIISESNNNHTMILKCLLYSGLCSGVCSHCTFLKHGSGMHCWVQDFCT